MNKTAFRIAAALCVALFAWNCSDDDDSSSSSTDSSTEATCSTDAVYSNPAWTGTYLIYQDGTVTNPADNSTGTFDFSTYTITMSDGTTVTVSDYASLPVFTGTYLVYLDGTVTEVDGTAVGTLDSCGNITLSDGSTVDTDGNTVESSSSEATETSSETTSTETSSETTSTESSSASSSSSTASSSSVQTGVVQNSGELDASGYEIGAYTDMIETGVYEGTGWSSRYWDGCKPHCSWAENVSTTLSSITSVDLTEVDDAYETAYSEAGTTAKNCNINDYEIPTFTVSPNANEWWLGIQGVSNACDSGTDWAFVCTDMAPVAVNDTLAYGFVAGPSSTTTCGKCFHLQFDGGTDNGDDQIKVTHEALAGKHMVVMTSNIGNDVEAGQFDLMVPGGGVGIYDAISSQTGVSEQGSQYGGFLTTCQGTLGYDASVAEYQECLYTYCEAAFSNFPNLLSGCLWFADWYMAADNPTYVWEEVDCPQYLVDKYKTAINTTIAAGTQIDYRSSWSDYTGDGTDLF